MAVRQTERNEVGRNFPRHNLIHGDCMESKVFYKTMDTALKPECQRLGFVRKKTTTSLWTLRLPAGLVVFEVAKGVKNPWLPYVGGRFKVLLDLIATNDPKDRDLRSCVSYMEYYDDADLEQMTIIRDGIVRKIVSQKDFEDDNSRMMVETAVPFLEWDLGRGFRRHQVSTLPYLDAEDVSGWGTFLAAKLAKTVEGITARPVFFMRTV